MLRDICPPIVRNQEIRRISYLPVQVSDKTRWAFIEMETADGTRGIGEATCFQGHHDFEGAAADLADRLRGKPIAAIEALDPLPASEDKTRWAVLSAVEQASWDIRGKLVGEPVHALLGAAVRENIPLYANINRRSVDRSPAGMAAGATAAAEAGFSQVKIAPFDGVTPGGTGGAGPLFAAGLDRIRAVQTAVAGRARVMVDCHWRLGLSQALRLLDLAAELDLAWVECPLPETPQTLADLRRLKLRAGELGIDLAGGEQGTSEAYFSQILGEGLYDIIMPDVKYVGGIQRLLRISRMAKAHDVALAPHNPSGPVAHLASLHAAMVTENLLILEHQFDEHPFFWTLSRDSVPRIENAHSTPPRGAGIGFSGYDLPG